MNMLISKSISPVANGPGLNKKAIMAIYAAAFSFLFSGCASASFSDRIIRNYKSDLTQENVSQLSGTYQLIPDLEYKEKGEVKISRSQYLVRSVHSYISKEGIDLDTLADLKLTIKILEKNNVTFLFKKDEVIVDSVTLSAELQPAGLLYLGNNYVEITGIPYLFGGIMSEKTRIGLAKDGGLILNHVFNSSGGALLIIIGGHYHQSAYHFKRINSK